MKTLPSFLLLLALLAGCAQPPPAAPVVRPVEVAVVPSPVAGERRVFSGVAESDLETQLAFRVAGEVVALPVRAGQHLAAGDLIGRLDATDYALQFAQAEAAVAQAQAQAANAAAEFERVRRLWENRNAAAADLERAEAMTRSTRSQLNAAERQLDLARQQVAYCTLRAPRAGVVASVRVRENQLVQAGQVVVEFFYGTGLQLAIGLPENLVNRVTLGLSSRVTFDALPGRVFTATVAEKGVIADATSTYPLKLALSGAADGVVPGMTGEAVLTFPTPDDTAPVVIPATALAGRLDERFVFVIGPDHRAERRPVVPGVFVDTGVQILRGLEPGETIAVKGANQLTDGMTVAPRAAARL